MWYDVMLVEQECGGAVMTETEKRMHRVCFTGHRPEKLTRHEKSITKDLEKEIRQAVADGLNVFITGMAKQKNRQSSR